MSWAGACRGAALLAGLLLRGVAHAQADTGADSPAAPVITVTGKVSSELRSYTRFLPGLLEFRKYHALAPAAELRIGLVSDAFPMRPLALSSARLEQGDWRVPLPLRDGWFTLPVSKEALDRDANVVIARRNGPFARWMIDVHTPGLPPQAYRLGDLRLECRVYLAIEWGVWHGALLMGKRVREPLAMLPMNGYCGGASVFFNTRPWPRLQAYVISEGGRTVRHELNGASIAAESLQLDVAPGDGEGPWSDDAKVEFVFRDEDRHGP